MRGYRNSFLVSLAASSQETPDLRRPYAGLAPATRALTTGQPVVSRSVPQRGSLRLLKRPRGSLAGFVGGGFRECWMFPAVRLQRHGRKGRYQLPDREYAAPSGF